MMGHTKPQPNYFPLDESGQNGVSKFVLNWYQSHAQAMGIPSLIAFAGQGEVEVYRFIELPTWAPGYAVTVTIESDQVRNDLAEPWLTDPGVGGEETNAARAAWHEWARVPIGEVKFVVLDGAGGYSPGEIAATGKSVLRQHQWAELRRLLDQANLFFERTSDPNLGLDGTQWILEQVRDGRYHMVERWSPDFNDENDPRNLAGFVAVAEWLRTQAVPQSLR